MTTLVAKPPENNTPGVIMSKPSGDRVFLYTDAGLLPQDTDGSNDVYERSGGTLKLVSTGPTGGNAAIGIQHLSISGDGAHAVFSTRESLVAEDTDSSLDLYDGSNDETKLVSTGPTGGNGAFDAQLLSDQSHHRWGFEGISDDGKVFFSTAEPLVESDTDGVRSRLMDRINRINKSEIKNQDEVDVCSYSCSCF